MRPGESADDRRLQLRLRRRRRRCRARTTRPTAATFAVSRDGAAGRRADAREALLSRCSSTTDHRGGDPHHLAAPTSTPCSATATARAAGRCGSTTIRWCRGSGRRADHGAGRRGLAERPAAARRRAGARRGAPAARAPAPRPERPRMRCAACCSSLPLLLFAGARRLSSRYGAAPAATRSIAALGADRQAGAGVRPAAAAGRRDRGCRARDLERPGRCWSISSPPGACPAGPSIRC